MRAILISSGLAAICSLLGTRFALGWFTRHGFGQPIRDDGPTTHHVKRGTPTMGGVVILLSATAAYLTATIVTRGSPSASAWLVMLLLFGCGVVGFLDDFIKVYTQNNQGLTSRARSRSSSGFWPRASSPTKGQSDRRRSTSPPLRTGGSSCRWSWSCW